MTNSFPMLGQASFDTCRSLVDRWGTRTLALTRRILSHGLFSASSKRSIPSCVGNAMAFCLPRYFTKIREGTHTGTLSDFGEPSGIPNPAFHGADPVRSRRFAHREKLYFCPHFPRAKVAGFLLTSIVHQSKRDACRHPSYFGEPSGIRTPDPLIKSQMLCQLS